MVIVFYKFIRGFSRRLFTEWIEGLKVDWYKTLEMWNKGKSFDLKSPDTQDYFRSYVFQ